MKVLNLRLLIMYQNKKTFLQKTMCHIRLTMFFLIKNVVGTFYKKEFQKAIQKEFRVEKEIKRKDCKLYVECKGYNNSFNS